jgi:hypothetical protein
LPLPLTIIALSVVGASSQLRAGREVARSRLLDRDPAHLSDRLPGVGIGSRFRTGAVARLHARSPKDAIRFQLWIIFQAAKFGLVTL